MAPVTDGDNRHDTMREQSLDHPARTVLSLLLSRHPGLVAVEELVRELAEAPQEHKLAEHAIQDGITDLVGDGMAHRIDRFVMASRAAVRAKTLME